MYFTLVRITVNGAICSTFIIIHNCEIEIALLFYVYVELLYSFSKSCTLRISMVGFRA